MIAPGEGAPPGVSSPGGVTIALLYMVDEDELVALRARLTSYGFQVIPVGSLEEGQRALGEHEIGCAFVEVRSTHPAGLSVIRNLKKQRPRTPIAVLSSNKDLSSRIAGRDAGAEHYLATPIRNIDLEMTIAEIRKSLAGLPVLASELVSELEELPLPDPAAEPEPGVSEVLGPVATTVPLPEPEAPQSHPLEHENRRLRTELAELRGLLSEAQQSAREAQRLAINANERLNLSEQHAQLALSQARALVDEARGSAREVPSISGRNLPEVDELTGLIGPGALQDHLDREYARARRYGHALSVLMLDVDRLGRYGKSYGQEAGDQALRLVADVLRSALRTPDIAARVGGDDFVILATDTSEEQAYQLAERLRAALREEAKHGSRPPITVSIGIASSRRLDVKRAEDLLVAAQHAVSLAKGAGRDQSVIAAS